MRGQRTQFFPASKTTCEFVSPTLHARIRRREVNSMIFASLSKESLTFNVAGFGASGPIGSTRLTPASKRERKREIEPERERIHLSPVLLPARIVVTCVSHDTGSFRSNAHLSPKRGERFVAQFELLVSPPSSCLHMFTKLGRILNPQELRSKRCDCACLLLHTLRKRASIGNAVR